MASVGVHYGIELRENCGEQKRDSPSGSDKPQEKSGRTNRQQVAAAKEISVCATENLAKNIFKSGVFPAFYAATNTMVPHSTAIPGSAFLPPHANPCHTPLPLPLSPRPYPPFLALSATPTLQISPSWDCQRKPLAPC